MAARLLSKAPWWAHPPAGPQQEIKSNMRTDTAIATNKSDAKVLVMTAGGPENWSLEKLSLSLTPAVQRDTGTNGLGPITAQALDARNALKESLNGMAAMHKECQDKAKTMLEDVRQTRFAIVAEVGAMVTPLKEIRQFFMGHDYFDELTRLREFVELCERLQKLKATGFLDTMADTILKLA